MLDSAPKPALSVADFCANGLFKNADAHAAFGGPLHKGGQSYAATKGPPQSLASVRAAATLMRAVHRARLLIVLGVNVCDGYGRDYV